MKDQLTIRLPEDLSQALHAAAEKMNRKSAEVVRMALREYLGVAASERKPIDRVRGLLGSVDSGVPDLAERHRDYVLKTLRRGE